MKDYSIGKKDQHFCTLAFMGTTRAHNSRTRKCGFAPLQWVLRWCLPLPTSLTSSTHNLAAQQTIDGEGTFQRRLQLLCDCDKRSVECDNDSRVRRCLLDRTRPTRGPFLAGTQVYAYRRQGNLGAPPVSDGWDLLLSSVPRGTTYGVALDTH